MNTQHDLPTQKEIVDVISNCPWCEKVWDARICSLSVNVCDKVINEGDCTALKELYGKYSEKVMRDQGGDKDVWIKAVS